MWPWEHLAIGYLVYSLLVRASVGRRPAAGGAVAVAVGTQFPDLVDKSLGWAGSVLPSGQSLAHSLLFAVPVVVFAGTVAVVVDRRDLGLAFGVGYLTHLPGDVVYPAMLGGDFNLSFLLWPVLAPGGSQPSAMFAHVQELFATFGALLATPQGLYYLFFELLLLAVALALWILDGSPGVPNYSRNSAGDVS